MAYLKSKAALRKKEHEWLDHCKMTVEPCEKCGSTLSPTLDHIIPLDLIRQFGIDVGKWWDKENVQLLCRRCNQFKGNRLDFADKRTKELLLKYLDNIV